jgi:hypothetical protein
MPNPNWSTGPSTITGIAMTIRASTSVALSKKPDLRMPAMTPAVTPTTAAKMIASSASLIVTGQAWAIMSLIGRPVSDVPKSPVSSPRM